MVLVKANNELKSVFLHLISTMKLKVEWNGIFVIINNNLILPGNVRTLFFNFDNRKMLTNIIDLTINEENAVEIEENAILSNAISMTLYAFGKWGAISGLKVEKNYVQLNKLFQNILKDIGIEPSFRDDNFRFFKAGIQITYEDVISEILTISAKQSEEEAKAEDEPAEKDEYSLGLWHNIHWISEEAYFLKEERTNEDMQKSRLGNNFYMVDYKCPMCENKLYMVTYPINKEFLVETDKERVYLARAYTCNACNCFYTPKPQRLLAECDVFSLKFEEDRAAYEDYRELLGIKGARCSNYKFNEYESERNKKSDDKEPDDKEPESLEEICDELDSMTEKELIMLKNKADDGFYSMEDVDKYYDRINEKLKSGKTDKNKKKNDFSPKFAQKFGKNSSKEKAVENDIYKGNKEKSLKFNKEQDFSIKSVDELRDILSELSSGEYDRDEVKEVYEIVKTSFWDKLRDKLNSHMAVIDRMSLAQLRELKSKILSEQFMDEDEREGYIRSIDKALYEGEERELSDKAEACKSKSYSEIERVIEEIEDRDIPNSIKRDTINKLRQLKREKGEREVESLIEKLPENVDKKKFQLFSDKLEQYKEVDITPYRRLLEDKRDIAEKNEINNLVKRANKRDRNALLKLIDQLRGQGFIEKNITPFIEKINERIYEIDKSEIEKICSDIMDLTFEEGLRVYEKISEGMYLPELKNNILENIDKRLTKIKMDECEQLVIKLEKEIDSNVSDKSRLYFYSPRKVLRGNIEDDEALVINKALETYASERGKYEFPILIAVRSKSGKDGFVLTPDHIFYNSLFESDVVSIFDIDSIIASTKLINKGMHIKMLGGSKIKLPNPITQKNEWCEFARVLGEFIEYLQEKPESRSISYLAEETHTVKCCYRCGYTYKAGNICPKCGSKSNN